MRPSCCAHVFGVDVVESDLLVDVVSPLHLPQRVPLQHQQQQSLHPKEKHVHHLPPVSWQLDPFDLLLLHLLLLHHSGCTLS